MRSRRSHSCSLLAAALTLGCGLTEETLEATPSELEDSSNDLPTEPHGLINETCEPLPKLDCSSPDVLAPEVSEHILAREGQEAWSQSLWDDYRELFFNYALSLIHI